MRANAAKWVSSGIASLAGDQAIQFVTDPAVARLSIGVELLKAYVMRVTSETRTVSVVVRVRYLDHDKQIAEQVYRGTENDTNWIDPVGEAQGSLDDAMSQILAAIRKDVLARCM